MILWTNTNAKVIGLEHTVFCPNTFLKRKGGKATFCGIVANSRVFKSERGKYVTFVTLGVGNGEYIDVTLHD